MANYIKKDIKGVRTEDNDTFYGYSSGFFHNEKLQKSKSLYAGEMKNSFINYHKTKIAQDINNVKKERN